MKTYDWRCKHEQKAHKCPRRCARDASLELIVISPDLPFPRQFLLQLATTVNSVPLPPVPEVYGIRLPPPAQRLTAPNFSLVPRSAGPPAPPGAEGDLDALAAFDAGLGTNGDGTATGEGSEGIGGGLFGEDEDEDDDADMEEIEAGLMGTNGSSSSGGGTKRRAEDDEDYD